MLVDAAGGYTPTPAVSHAILAHNHSRAAGLADGIVITPSHNPPQDGGFKYNPPNGGPADTDATKWIAGRANELLAAKLDGVRRRPLDAVRGDLGKYDFMGAYVADLPAVLNLDAIRSAGIRIGADPHGRRQRRLLGRDRRAARARPHGRQPEGRPPVRLHDAGLGRQDPHGLLVAVRDGVAGRRGAGDYQIATGNDADADRHGIVTADAGPDEPEPLPRRRHRLPLREPPRLAGGRRDRQDGRELVHDRPGRRTTSAGGSSRPRSGSSGSSPA